MTPVLSPVQVVGYVEVLVAVLQGLMLVMTLRPRQRSPLSGPDGRQETTVHRLIEAGPDHVLLIAEERLRRMKPRASGCLRGCL
jgi:hypothetical protein